MDANKKDEEIQKLKDELQRIKETSSNQFGGTMMQIASQIDEKFGKMEKEMEKLKSANEGLKRKMDNKNEEFAGKNAKMEKEMNEIAVLKGRIVEKDKEMGKLKEKMAKMDQEFARKNAKMDEMAKKMKEIEAEKNGEMGKMKTAFDRKIVEFEGKMRELLEKKADKEMLVHFKNNKWNVADCGPDLAISEGGLFIKHSADQNGWNCIRAISPIPPFILNSTKPSIAGYFEAEITNGSIGGFRFGFCTQQFRLEGKWLGDGANSIGIDHKAGIHIDGRFNKFENNANGYFKFEDEIGVGIIHFPANKSMKCFATCNGQLLGTVELPDKFASLQLFPAASLYGKGDSIRANFGQETLRFDASRLLQ